MNLELLSSDIASRIPEMARDSSINNAEVIKGLIRQHSNKSIKQVDRDLALLMWAVSRWNAEVGSRPLVNVHRRTLDDTWRQVIRYAGGDPLALVGFAHDDLVSMARSTQGLPL